jgi:DNA-binding MarR family transcriptional regulator
VGANPSREPMSSPDDSSGRASGAEHAEDDLKTFTVRHRDVTAAARLLRAIVSDNHDLAREITALSRGNVRPAGQRAILIECARQMYVNRARRAQIFSNMMFGEAAWDMLLALYVTDQSGQRHTVSGLANLSGAAPTTALRWLDFLEKKEGLVKRKPNPTDRRTYMVELTEKAREGLDAYFFEVIEDLRPLAGAPAKQRNR